MTRSSEEMAAEAIYRIGGAAQPIIPDPHPPMDSHILVAWEVTLAGYLDNYRRALLADSDALGNEGAALLGLIRRVTERGYEMRINITKTGA